MSAMKKTIMTVSGIRPDFIRMSSIFKKLDDADWCNHILVHTGQHYDDLLSGVFQRIGNRSRLCSKHRKARRTALSSVRIFVGCYYGTH